MPGFCLWLLGKRWPCLRTGCPVHVGVGDQSVSFGHIEFEMPVIPVGCSESGREIEVRGGHSESPACRWLLNFWERGKEGLRFHTLSYGWGRGGGAHREDRERVPVHVERARGAWSRSQGTGVFPGWDYLGRGSSWEDEGRSGTNRRLGMLEMETSWRGQEGVGSRDEHRVSTNPQKACPPGKQR